MIPQTRAAIERLEAAEYWLSQLSRTTGGHGVEAIWLDGAERASSRAMPDALYINRGDPYFRTQLYDARRGVILTLAWGDWLESVELAPGAP